MPRRLTVALLDKDLPTPLYHQLKEALIQKLRTGVWKPNDRFPTEDELVQEYGVSKVTVRQALRDLAQAGLVRREQGRGTFVAEQKVQFGPRYLTSFTEEMKELGLRSVSRVLEQSVEPAAGKIADDLQVAEGTPLFRLRRLRLAGGEPMGLQTAYIPVSIAPDLHRQDFSKAPLYETLERRYRLIPVNAVQKHYAVALRPEDAILLGAPAGSPALGGERLTFTKNGSPLELTMSLMRGDRYQIEMKLVRRAGQFSPA